MNQVSLLASLVLASTPAFSQATAGGSELAQRDCAGTWELEFDEAIPGGATEARLALWIEGE